MSECRYECGVEVLDGVLYAIGGCNKSVCLKSVEAYTSSSGVWATIADMHFSRYSFGRNKMGVLNSMKIYNPKTNTWSLKTLSKEVGHIFGEVVVNKPPHFKTYDD